MLMTLSDVLFSNIKHLFFQPCDHELIVIVHIHLKSPIMVGKKKTKVRLSAWRVVYVTEGENRTSNSTGRHLMSNLTRLGIGRGSTGMVTRMRSSMNSRKEGDGRR